LAGKELNEKREFIKSKGLCFGCLKPGHRSQQCTSRSECKKCKKRHPTCLHEDRQENRQNAEVDLTTTSQTESLEKLKCSVPQSVGEQRDVEKATSYAVQKTTLKTEVGMTSMVVPVYVSREDNPSREVLVYALLDTTSDSTFIARSVADDLQTPFQHATLRLTTMSDTNSMVDCRKYSGLKVRGFSSDDVIRLPTCYSRDHIPINEEHIPTPLTTNGWPHLSRLENLLTPKQDCPVGLLIGYNCPAALAPLTCIRGEANQPYAVETALGWSVVGGAPNPESFNAIGVSHSDSEGNAPGWR
jgi:hypothetical protein